MFAVNLKQLRRDRGLSQAALAEILHVSQSTIGMWESGARKPDIETMATLAAFFNVSADYLLSVEGSNTRQLLDTLHSGRWISVLGRVPAGVPIEAVEDIIDKMELSEQMTSDGYDYFGLMVSGDSMYPEYRDGDVLVVRKQTTAETGQDVIVYINSQDATVKRVVIAEDSITLRAVNPAYESKTYTAEDIARLPIVIAGVVVELRRKRI